MSHHFIVYVSNISTIFHILHIYSFYVVRYILLFWTTHHLIQLSARAKECEWQREGGEWRMANWNSGLV